MSILDRALRVGEGKKFKAFEKNVSRINDFEPELELETDDELRERSYGAAEGLTGHEVDVRFADRPVPGRETRQQVLERVRPALIRIAERHPGQSVLVVSHGGVIGSLVRHTTDWAWPEQGQLIPNGSAHRFAYRDGDIGLVEFNGRPWVAPRRDADAPAR